MRFRPVAVANTLIVVAMVAYAAMYSPHRLAAKVAEQFGSKPDIAATLVSLPALVANYTSQYETLPATPARLVLVGDEIVAFSNVTAHVDALNRAIPFEPLDHVARRIGEINRHLPEVVWLMLGRREVIAGENPATVAAGVRALAARLHGRVVISGVPLLPPHPHHDVTAANERLRRYNAALGTAATDFPALDGMLDGAAVRRLAAALP